MSRRSMVALLTAVVPLTGDGVGRDAHPQTLVWLIIASAVAVWMLRHPFVGIEHDGIIYAAMAGVSSGILPLGSDLFFSHGAQFHYSIYPAASGALVAALGISAASALIVAFAHSILLAAAWYLVRPLTNSLVAATALLALAIAYPYYGNSAGQMPLLAFGEGFATARPLAEAIGLLAVALASRRQSFWALAACLLAFALHPLTALVVVGFVLLWHFTRWQHVALLAVAGTVFICIGVWSRSGWFFLEYDGAWWEVIDGTQATLLFPTRTSVNHHAWNVLALSVSALGLLSRDQVVRRIARIVVALAIAGTVFAFIAEASRIAGFVAVQTWRAGWLVSVVGALMLPVLMRELMVRPDARVFWIAPIACGWLAMALTSDVWIAVVAVAAAAIALTPVCEGLRGKIITSSIANFAPAFERVRLSFVAAPVMVLLALAVWRWDARTAWSQFIARQYVATSPVDAVIPADASVFWVGGPVTLQWFWLKRGSYAHLVAAANAGFSRELGVEFMRRNEELTPLWTLTHPLCTKYVVIDGMSACMATPDNIAAACNNARLLGYVLAPSETQAGARFKLTYPSPVSGQGVEVNGYRCEDFRSNE